MNNIFRHLLPGFDYDLPALWLWWDCWLVALPITIRIIFCLIWSSTGIIGLDGVPLWITRPAHDTLLRLIHPWFYCLKLCETCARQHYSFSLDNFTSMCTKVLWNLNFVHDNDLTLCKLAPSVILALVGCCVYYSQICCFNCIVE